MCRLAALLGDSEPASLKARTTRESWEIWERFYEQDPWGEVRQDLRMLASLMLQWNPRGEVRMVWPYFVTEEESLEQLAQQEKQLAAMDMAAIEAKFAKALEEHEAKKKAKHG